MSSPCNYRQFEELVARLAFTNKPIANRNSKVKRIIVMHDAIRHIQGKSATAGLIPCALHQLLSEPRTPDLVKEIVPFPRLRERMLNQRSLEPCDLALSGKAIVNNNCRTKFQRISANGQLKVTASTRSQQADACCNVRYGECEKHQYQRPNRYISRDKKRHPSDKRTSN